MTLTRRNSFALFAMLTAALFAVEAWIATAIPSVDQPGVVAVAITADIAVGVPLLYYVLLARKNYLPTGGIVALYLLSLAAVRWILPASQQAHLGFVETLLPLGEVVALGMVALKARDIIRHVRRARSSELYVADAVRKGLRAALGDSLVTTLLATEFSLLYFAGVGWVRRFRTNRTDSGVFSYHKRSGFTAIVFGLLCLMVVEAVILHLLIQHWSDRAAWLFTALNVYTLVWGLGYYHAVRLQPIVLDATCLHLRTGFLWRAEIPLARITAVRKAQPADKQKPQYLNIAVFGEPRLVIELDEPATVTGLFGRTKQASLIGVTIDAEDTFLGQIGSQRALR